MARARNIKPGFYKNEDLAECSVWARLIFPGLWMMADRQGRLEYRPKRIKGELLPYDTVDVEPLLRELERFDFIKVYTANGIAYIQIVKFLEHQNPHHKEAASTIPAPDGIPPSPGSDSGSKPQKPGVSPSCNEHESETSPGQAPDLTPVEGGVNRADSLIPDSGFLIPDSPIPESSSVDHQSRGRDDSQTPRSPADWCRHFAEHHGVDVDPHSLHARKKAWPIFTAWVSAGVTTGMVDAAVRTARAEAKEPIAFLPAYVDRVMASQSPQQLTPQRRTVGEARENTIAALTGRNRNDDERDSFTVDVDAHRVD